MTINPPTKAAKKAEAKKVSKEAAHIDALERELHRAKTYGQSEARIKEIAAELAKFKPAKKESVKDSK